MEVDKEYLKTVDKMTLLKSLRNGIAHQNILASNKHGIWAGIVLWNLNRSNEKTFEIELETLQLTKLATYIANHYLIKKQKNHVKSNSSKKIIRK